MMNFEGHKCDSFLWGLTQLSFFILCINTFSVEKKSSFQQEFTCFCYLLWPSKRLFPKIYRKEEFFQQIVMASSSSRRVSDGLNAMAFGSVLVSGGVAAGVEVAASAALKVRSQQRTQNEVSLIHEFSSLGSVTTVQKCFQLA